MSKKFKISVIIPIYNVEEYLSETLDSVINQSIGFKDNIEMILINDGSPDNSEEICLKYKEKYPDNIVYYKQKNAGVSAARNKGIELAHGEYINFLDSDDKFENTAYEEGVDILTKNPEVSSVIYRLKFFDAKKGPHYLNRVLKETNKIIDIRDDENIIKMQCCSILLRKKSIKEIRFLETLALSEDSLFLTEYFLNNPLTIVAESYYLYRKRQSETSAIQTSLKKKNWYLDTPKLSYKGMIDLSLKKYGEVLPYVQRIIIYEFKWRMSNSGSLVLDKNEREEYIKLLKECFEYVNDETIINSIFLNNREKLYQLNFKHNNKSDYNLKDGKLYIGDAEIFDYENIITVIDTIFEKNGKLLIYGRIPIIKNVLEKVYLKDENGQKIDFEYYELDDKKKTIFAINAKDNFEYKGIKASISLKECHEYKLIGNIEETELKYIFSYVSPLSNKFKSLYLRTSDKYVYCKKNTLFVKNKNIFNGLLLETRCMYNLIKKRKIKSLIYRISSYIYSIFKTKKIWLISDRIQIAGDNGEAFFEYLNKKELKDVKVYFAIAKGTADYDRLKEKHKNVIDQGSFKYKMLFLNANKIISSQADDYVINAFGKSKVYISDMYKFDFIFLQHGIIYNDLSDWLNMNSKKIDIFLTSSQREYDSILSSDNKYNYNKDIVKLTGLPRYDKLLLEDVKKEKEIVIMPTWRQGLVSKIDVRTGKRIYDANFKKNDYFNFYNTLINDEKLIKALKKYGYKIRFIPHPNMMQQIEDFDINPLVEIPTESVNYSKEFKRNSLLITDYSSIFFDFCYLNKPVIYCHFDQDVFYDYQLYQKGYFDHVKDGFGPVTRDVDDTVEAIIKIVKRDCTLESKYQKRINNFYAYRDNKNCERVLREIQKHDK